MANLLYLVHRLPFPPNKGDKVRSYHLLKDLADKHRVFVGTFIDDPADEIHIDRLRSLCAGLYVAPLHPARARFSSLMGLLSGDALTLHYYRDAGLQRWVEQTVLREQIDAVVVFSSSMAQYAEGLNLPTLVDFVDVDSAKWAQYANNHRWPLSWLYRREGERLLAYERGVAGRAARSFFVTEQEAALFKRLAPECGAKVEAIGNGVDADHFAPHPQRPSPFDPAHIPLVFTGAMDYWPNIDAVSWFARDVVPQLVSAWPALRFVIVGRSPPTAVQSLAGAHVIVTGTVPDVRPYLQHAAVVVAPLRLARGIQNKILEAMAMARPVVASAACAEAIRADVETGLLTAADAESFVAQIAGLLSDPVRAAVIGHAGRQFVGRQFSWSAHLAAMDRHLLGVAMESVS